MKNTEVVQELAEELDIFQRKLANFKLRKENKNLQKQLKIKLTEIENCLDDIHILIQTASTPYSGTVLTSCKAINFELEKGQQIQIDFLPSNIYQPDRWDINACFYPAKKVSGDFYDTFRLGKYVGLTIGDVCDKGVGAAMFMALMRSLIRVFSGQTDLQGLSIIPQEKEAEMTVACYEQIQALQAVELTNRYIAENHWRLCMFATLFFGVLDPDTGLLAYINGGHEPLFVVGSSGIKQTLSYTGPAVGITPNVKFDISTVQLEPGDLLVGYTDGVTEGKNPKGELFTFQRLQALVQIPVTSSSKLIDRIKVQLFSHIDSAEQFDDITLLVAKWLPD